MAMDQVDFKKPDQNLEVRLPMVPLGWRILVRPYKPPSEWGEAKIAIAETALESEELLTCVGEIVAMGDQCFTAKTRSGIDMSKIEPKPKVGDWIMYGTYGGQKIVTKTGVRYLVMNDDSIMGIVNDPSEFRAYL